MVHKRSSSSHQHEKLKGSGHARRFRADIQDKITAESKRKPDLNELAFAIVAQATGQDMKDAPPIEIPADAVSAVLRAMGRRGGLKGGKARAATLTPAKRTAIAKKAAAARWSKTARARR
jgi:hypothetical protein